jgi:hypothetical protein
MASSEPSAAEPHSDGPLYSLENILGDDHDKLEHPHTKPEGWDEEDTERDVAHGYCIECEGAWCPLPQISSPIYALALQTNQQRCTVAPVRMITAKSASQHSIEKAAGKSTPQNP